MNRALKVVFGLLLFSLFTQAQTPNNTTPGYPFQSVPGPVYIGIVLAVLLFLIIFVILLVILQQTYTVLRKRFIKEKPIGIQKGVDVLKSDVEYSPLQNQPTDE
jgi:hypothetical protein